MFFVPIRISLHTQKNMVLYEAKKCVLLRFIEAWKAHAHHTEGRANKSLG